MTSEFSLREICFLALMGAFMVASQVALAALPNIHIVALLIIITTLCFSWRALFSIAVFVMLEGLLYGFGIWWISYLYVWPLLVPVVIFFRSSESAIFWAVIAGLHGLLFGALTAIPYLFIGGWQAAVSYWISGIPFDLLHCVGNFTVTLVLLKPLLKITRKLI